MSSAFGTPVDRLEEGELVERAKHEPAAFGELYARYHGRVYRFACARLGGRAADAEDLTAEVFLRALTAIGRYQDTGKPFQAWLFQIAHNAAVDCHRQRRRRQHEDIDERQDDLVADVNVEDLVEQRELVRRILDAAEQLPPWQRQVLALRFGHDLTHPEVGRLFGRSGQASKIGQIRAIAAVRKALGAADQALGLAS